MSFYEDVMQGLQEALEHAQGKRRLRTHIYHTPDIIPVKEFEPSEIREIRMSLGLTQVDFAGFMGVSAKTVEAWESGRNKPIGPARRMLSLVQNDPGIVKQFVHGV